MRTKLFVAIGVILIIAAIIYFNNTVENFEDSNSSKQVTLLTKKYSNDILSLDNLFDCLVPKAGKKHKKGAECEDMPSMTEDEELLINFYSLGCRFTGYLGPMKDGFWDPTSAVRLAVKAGCRVFVLEIDYLPYFDIKFPRICIRDKKGNLLTNSDNPRIPNTLENSNITDVCNNINLYAFSSDNKDPVIIVLYFLRLPSKDIKSQENLNFLSNVATCISRSTLNDKLLKIETNGTFNRQSQESLLLSSKITNYQNKVLLFSNADTSGFRPASANQKAQYDPSDDLDFLVNLRLYTNNTALGATTKGSGFGVLQPAEDYLIISSESKTATIEASRKSWTMCLSNDPSVPVTQEIYNTITSTYGINCVPIVLFDKGSDFMTTIFKNFSYIPKPPELRIPQPMIAVAVQASTKMDAKQGKLLVTNASGTGVA